MNATIAVFSNLNFVIADPQIGVAGPSKDADLLKAVALYFNSSIARYLLFFHSASWGSTVSKINPKELRHVPFPQLDTQQVQQLAALYDGFATTEKRRWISSRL